MQAHFPPKTVTPRKLPAASTPCRCPASQLPGPPHLLAGHKGTGPPLRSQGPYHALLLGKITQDLAIRQRGSCDFPTMRAHTGACWGPPLRDRLPQPLPHCPGAGGSAEALHPAGAGMSPKGPVAWGRWPAWVCRGLPHARSPHSVCTPHLRDSFVVSQYRVKPKSLTRPHHTCTRTGGWFSGGLTPFRVT